MKITLIKRRPAKHVRVIDCNGVVAYFDSAKKAAEALQCTPQYVYLGLRTGRFISGCKVEVVE